MTQWLSGMVLERLSPLTIFDKYSISWYCIYYQLYTQPHKKCNIFSKLVFFLIFSAFTALLPGTRVRDHRCRQERRDIIKYLSCSYLYYIFHIYSFGFLDICYFNNKKWPWWAKIYIISSVFRGDSLSRSQVFTHSLSHSHFSKFYNCTILQ